MTTEEMEEMDAQWLREVDERIARTPPEQRARIIDRMNREIAECQAEFDARMAAQAKDSEPK